MKPKGLLSIIVFTLVIWSCRSLFGCPTCVGRVDGTNSTTTPAFFQSDFYTPQKKSPKQQAPTLKTMHQALINAHNDVTSKKKPGS